MIVVNCGWLGKSPNKLDITMNNKTMSLTEYIDKYYKGSQSALAKAQDVHRQQITKWINGEFIAVGHELYSPRRKLKKPVDRGKDLD